MSIFKILRLALIVILISYFFGCFWFLLCIVEMELPEVFVNSNKVSSVNEDGSIVHNSFYDIYELSQSTSLQNLIKGMYFGFTTLSTVGFGDFNPKSDTERVVMIVIFVGGVAIFSIVMSAFLESLQKYSDVTADNEEQDDLNRFFILMVKFNNGQFLKRELKE